MPEASRRAGAHKTAPAGASIRVAIGLGSNRCHGRHGRPEAIVRAAAVRLATEGLTGLRLSRIHTTAPLGPSKRCFANAVATACWSGSPDQLLATLKTIERAFGRRKGRRWGPRVLDLDLLAFGEAVIRLPGLSVPHPGLAVRDFALRPFTELWPDWRHPVHHLPARALLARLHRPRAIDPPSPSA